jgi:hypothetical protein
MTTVKKVLQLRNHITAKAAEDTNCMRKSIAHSILLAKLILLSEEIQRQEFQGDQPGIGSVHSLIMDININCLTLRDI